MPPRKSSKAVAKPARPSTRAARLAEADAEPQLIGEGSDAPLIGEEPPKTEAPKRTRRPGAGRPRRMTFEDLEEHVHDFIVYVSVFVGMANFADSEAIRDGAPAQARALVNLARTNDNVRRALERMVQTTALGEIVMAFAPTFIRIAANHSLVSPELGALMAMTQNADKPSTNGSADATADTTRANIVTDTPPATPDNPPSPLG